MFGSKKKDLAQRENRYERAIRRLHDSETVILSVARATKIGAFFAQSQPHRLPTGVRAIGLTGVVDELMSNSHRIGVDVAFDDYPWLEDSVGSFMLTHYDAGTDEKTQPFERPLRLDVQLSDPDGMMRAAIWEAMRDAAVSQARFQHITLTTQHVGGVEALRLVRETGVGPSVQITSVRVWPTVTLPNLPLWARKTIGEL